MLKALVLLAAALTLGILAVSPLIGWQVAFVAKPIVDIGWSPEYVVFGLTPIEIVGAGVPAILLARMLMFTGEYRRGLPLGAPWAAYVITVATGGFMYAIQGDFVGAASFPLRALSGVLGYYSIAVWFGDRDRFRLFVVALLVAGLVPMMMGLYESTTGHSWRIRYGAGDQIRITGLYHNSINYRYYAYATLTAIAFYWIYFARRNNITKLLLLGYTAICLVVLFRVYSKAGFVTLGAAVVAWILIGRSYFWPIALMVAAVGANLLLGDTIVKEVTATFEKDVAAFSEGEIGDRAFGGRLGTWRRQWDSVVDQDPISLMVGSGEKGGGRAAKGGGHNDYIRALYQTGVLGLAAYVWLLAAAGLALMRLNLKRRSPLSLIALVVWVAWMVDTIGLTPSVYPSYQWFSWGLIGLALAGVRGLEGGGPSAPTVVTPRHRRGNLVDLQSSAGGRL
jgi:hypothetical protein